MSMKFTKTKLKMLGELNGLRVHVCVSNISKLHDPSMFAVKAKIIECYIIKPAQSLLMKHLVIGQR